MMDPPADHAPVFLHKDQPTVVPFQLLDSPEAVLPIIDRVVTEKGIIVKECFGNVEAPVVQSGLDGLIAECIECLGRRAENFYELFQIKGLKHSRVLPYNTDTASSKGLIRAYK